VPIVIAIDRWSRDEASELPVLALSGRRWAVDQCPVLAVKQTSQIYGAMSANDPKRKSALALTVATATPGEPMMVGIIGARRAAAAYCLNPSCRDEGLTNGRTMRPTPERCSSHAWPFPVSLRDGWYNRIANMFSEECRYVNF
jgi:hypothetical protein